MKLALQQQPIRKLLKECHGICVECDLWEAKKSKNYEN